MYVCLCRGVTDSQIREAVSDGATTSRMVSERLGTATQCGSCGIATRNIINSELENLAEAQSEQFYAA
jgi:bacterioferritin-associated ferredoxin